MAYKCSFLDNQAYTAQDVNDIFARISCGGVVFTDTGYILGDLNRVQEEMVTEGVVRDENSCRVVEENGVYKISKGACFMNDGSAIIFDDNGYEIEIVPESMNYVYLYRNAAENSIDIVVSQYEWDEECIPLAIIDEDGYIYDRRRYAKAKVDICTEGKLQNFTVNFVKCGATVSETITLDLGNGAFSHLIFWDGERIYYGKAEQRVAKNRNLKELTEGEEILLSIGKNEGTHNEYISCKKNGQYLELYLMNPIPFAEYTLNVGVI